MTDAKLHGSVNSVQCQKCSVAQPLPLGDFFTRHRYGWDMATMEEGKPVQLTIEQALGRLEHCGETCAAEALIVPPTWNKSAVLRRHPERVASRGQGKVRARVHRSD